MDKRKRRDKGGKACGADARRFRITTQYIDLDFMEKVNWTARTMHAEALSEAAGNSSSLSLRWCVLVW